MPWYGVETAKTPPANGWSDKSIPPGRMEVTNKVSILSPPNEHMAGFFTGKWMV